jgi:hypothetical protein
VHTYGEWESPLSENKYGRHHWKTDYSLPLELSELTLRESHLRIQIREEEVISTIAINLFDCATGPSHFDYVFQGTQKDSRGKPIQRVGKLSFDLLFS